MRPRINRIFSEAQWQKVKNSLAAVDVVDADELCRAVEGWAYSFATQVLGNRRTPKQRASYTQKRVAVLELALRAIGDGGCYGGGDMVALHAALAQEIAGCREFIARSEAQGSGSKQNRRSPLHEYWRGLVEYWRRFTNVNKHQRKHLQNFLLACSLPLLPQIEKNGQRFSEKDLERQVSNFVGNLLRKKCVNETSKPAVVYAK